MGVTDSSHFSTKHNSISELAKAISHPARVAIIDYLLKENGCICNDIVDSLPLSQPTVSQHIKALKQAGLIVGEIKGNSICYYVNKSSITKLKKYMDKLSEKLEKLIP